MTSNLATDDLVASQGPHNRDRDSDDVFEGGPRYPSALVPEISPERLDERDLAPVPFGRNRFLRRLGAALFGVTITSVVLASPALAACPTSPPAMCCCSKRCCCCNSGGCCAGGCTRRYGCSAGAGSCNCGWYTCYQGYRYFCSDWYQPTNDPCTCQILIGCTSCSC